MARPPITPQRKVQKLVTSTAKQTQVTSLIEQGIALHQRGMLKEAQAIYGQVLAIQSNDVDALQLLGALSAQTKQFTKAVILLTKALEINPNHVPCYYNRGIALQELKRLDEALHSYDKAIAIKPDYADAHYNRGNVLKGLQRLNEALHSYNKAIAIKPDYAQAYSNRGNILQELQRIDEALANYDKALAIKPDYAEAYSNRGTALKKMGRFDEALHSYDNAIAINPDYADAYYNRGNALKELQRLDEALHSYDKAIAINPDYAGAYYNRGDALKQLQRLDEALVNYDKVIAINPDFAQAHSNRGNALQELNRLDEAVHSYNNAIAITPDYADAHSNRGIALKKLERLDEALRSYDNAIAIKPDFAEAYYNRGISLQELLRLDEALHSYSNAIAIKPNYVDAHWNLSLCKLLGGNFKDGLQGYEWRWKSEGLSKAVGLRSLPQPLWLGAESLKHKTILLHSEQGLGDTLQFCRYAPLVARLGATVILEVQSPLVKLLKNLEGVSQVIAEGDTLPAFDYQCPLLSLPLAFKTELHSIPPVLQHVAGDQEKVAKWQTKLGAKDKLRVGLVWSGGALHKNDHNRSLTVSQLLPYLPDHAQYVCLQKEVRNIDKGLLAQHSEIKYVGDALEDFTDTAALCELMDVVISVDTSVAHLACALGKMTWILLPFAPDWRWLLDRDDNPWYRTAKLYRQDKINDWNGVLKKVQSDLLALNGPP
jgi:tetratricopeptide (TPR) repeat protein